MSKFKSGMGKLKTHCRWFARCDNIAVTTEPHPVLGAVPICQRCLNKLKRIGTVKPLPADDPRNPLHPSHDETWLEVARTLGRALADRDFDKRRSDKDEK